MAWKNTQWLEVNRDVSRYGFLHNFCQHHWAEIPNDRAIDGIDQTDFLLGTQEKSERISRIVFYDGNDGPVAVRYHQFKLVTNTCTILKTFRLKCM